MRVSRFRSQTIFAGLKAATAGLSVGLVGSTSALVWLALIGTNLASTVALTAALTAGVAAGLVFANRWSSTLMPRRSMTTGIALAVLAAACSVVLDRALNGLLTVGLQAVEPRTLFGELTALLPCSGFVALAVALIVAAACAADDVAVDDASTKTIGMSKPLSLSPGFGFGLGILVPLLNVRQQLPLGWLAAAGVLPMLAVLAWGLARHRVERSDARRTADPTRWRWAADPAIFGVALAVPAIWHWSIYLMPAALWMLPVAAAGLAMATVVFGKLLSLPVCRAGDRLRAIFILGSAALATLPFLFDALLTMNLQWSAQISDPVWLTAIRAVELLCLLCPVALCTAVTLSANSSGDGRMALRNPVMATGGGIACGLLAVGSGLPPAWLMLTAVSITLAGGLRHAVSEWRAGPAVNRHFTRITLSLGSLGLAIAGAILFPPQSSYERAERLLFSTRGLQGLRAGEDPGLIQQSDDTRCVYRSMTHDGPVSVWRQAASQLHIRRHGLPVASAGTNPMLTPLPAFEVLSVVLPFAFHSAPRELLILGDDGGMVLRTASGLPLPSIHAVRRDAGVTGFIEKSVWESLPIHPADDERVTMEHAAPAWRIRALAPDSFDIAIVASPPATVPGAATEFTCEFYRTLRSVVRNDGLVCQQVHQDDIGGESLTRMMATMQTAFAEVAVVQATPGKILLLGSASDAGIVRRGFVDRLSRDYVCELLAESGLDWVEAATLPLVDAGDPVGIFANGSLPAASTVASADFALQLPLDAIRPVNKADELAAAFSPYQQLLISKSRSQAINAEVARRMSALTQQKEILSEFPDRPWTYRRSLRSEMERNPRPPREKVENGEVVRSIDPREQIRIDYFQTLSEVSGMTAPAPEEIDRVAAFSGTHEPLVNQFARHEALRLMEKAGDPRSDVAFRHRIKATYFTVGKDRSVRHVAAAIQQLLDEPELIASTEDRFDVVNSLLQILHQRWQMRRDFPPGSARIVENDIRLTLAAVERALDQLPVWAEQAGLDSRPILDRRKFLNKSLISPLYQYREQVIAHRAKGAIANAAAVLPDEDVLDPDADPILIPREVLQTN